MRIGVFGGTFDPVHMGHLVMAEACRTQLKLDRVCFVPAAIPPHKLSAEISPEKIRQEMLSLALSGYPEFVVDVREFGRTGPSFTVTTLEEFTHEWPQAELWFLMGADSLRDLMTWKDPGRISALARLAVCNRPGIALPERSQIVDWVGEEIAERVTSVRIPGTDVSASEIRKRVRSGDSIRFLVPKAVEVYIAEHGLYRSREPGL